MMKDYHKELAEKHGLSVGEIKKICDSQFEFLKETIQSGEDQQVRLQYLGTFKVMPGRRETVKKRRERMRENYEKGKRDKGRG